jgi:predicted site-specific integrase-resolvase
LADPNLGTLLVEHRDRLARFGVGMVEATLQARGGRLLVIEEKEVDDDLVGDMTEILTGFCARLYGRRSAANRAKRAISIVKE